MCACVRPTRSFSQTTFYRAHDIFQFQKVRSYLNPYFSFQHPHFNEFFIIETFLTTLLKFSGKNNKKIKIIIIKFLKRVRNLIFTLLEEMT